MHHDVRPAGGGIGKPPGGAADSRLNYRPAPASDEAPGPERRYRRARAYDYDGYRSRRSLRYISVVMSAAGLVVSGIIVVVLLARPPQVVPAMMTATPPTTINTVADGQVEAIFTQVLQQPAVAQQLQDHLADWIASQQVRQMQQELAQYIKSEDFYQALVASLKARRPPAAEEEVAQWSSGQVKRAQQRLDIR